jgi:pimeloyl-ACP methyl ester carboxylesterase
MAPVARELSRVCGVLEPLQTASSIEGQVSELREALEKYGQLPITLVGHSWGAWLGIIFAVRYPSLVKKLILVDSGPFEEKYAFKIAETREGRLSEKDKSELLALEKALNDPGATDKNTVFARFGELMSKADSYDLLPVDEEKIDPREDINRSVWREAESLRRSGELLELAKRVRCPVVAIHGDYDPHPAEGVERPLRQALKDFRFILLKDCGHEPWNERRASDRFYSILKEELR